LCEPAIVASMVGSNRYGNTASEELHNIRGCVGNGGGENSGREKESDRGGDRFKMHDDI